MYPEMASFSLNGSISRLVWSGQVIRVRTDKSCNSAEKLANRTLLVELGYLELIVFACSRLELGVAVLAVLLVYGLRNTQLESFHIWL